MAKLIVTQGGNARRFKLNEGTLTIGSGDSATLTVDSDQIAEVHAHLTYEDGEAVLRLEKGVAPARVQGRPATGQIKLRSGVAVKIGDVEIAVELEEEGAAASAAPKRRGPDSVRIQHTRRRIERSKVPSWVIVPVVLVGALGVYASLKSYSKASAVRGFDPKASQVHIEKSFGENDYKGVLTQLEHVDSQESLSAEWKTYFDGARKRAETMQEEAKQISRNVHGTTYYQTQLKRFVDDRMRSPTRPAARVLMKRIEEFRRNYPLHPQLAWCDRMIERYGDIAEMSSPPDYEDVAFEVKTLTWAKPRDYKLAFALLDQFMASADTGDRDMAMALVQEKEVEREEYFNELIQQAAYEWEEGQYGAAVEWLVQIITKIGDDEMADDAARRVTEMEGVDYTLRGYKNDRPETFNALMQNSIMKRYAQENDVL